MHLTDDDAPATRLWDPVFHLLLVSALIWLDYGTVTGYTWGVSAVALLATGIAAGTAVQGGILLTDRGRRYERWRRDHPLLNGVGALLLSALLVGSLTQVLTSPWPPLLQFGYGMLVGIAIAQAGELLWFRRRSTSG